jgi:chromosome partitioning protein
MSFPDVVSSVNSFIKEYYPLLSLISATLTVLFGVRFGWWQTVWNKVRSFWRTDVRALKRQNAELNNKLAQVRDAYHDDNDLWLREPINKPTGYDVSLQRSIPILLIANLKGGVGKTTVAANLATYFEAEHDERVLAIDLDYQGSLSSMLLPAPNNREERSAQAIKELIRGSASGHSALANSLQIRNSTKDSRIIDCDDPFANFETRLVLKWLVGDLDGDIRYNLARVLHSSEIQDAFDRIIIDAPPRFTTGFINALCASTHLIVPFVLDILSAERVGLSLRKIKRMRGQLFPHLELAGVVGTMKRTQASELGFTEKKAVAEARRRVMQNWGRGDYVLKDALIPRKQIISDNAGIAPPSPHVAREVFAPLGREIFARTSAVSPLESDLSLSTNRQRRGRNHEGQFADSPVA